MSLDQKDLELIERVIYKNGDDIAVSIARSFERIEERMDAMESRIYSRTSEVESGFDVLDGKIFGQVSEINDRLTELLEG